MMLYIIIAVIIWVVFAFIIASRAGRYDGSKGFVFICSLMLSPIAGLIALVADALIMHTTHGKPSAKPDRF